MIPNSWMRWQPMRYALLFLLLATTIALYSVVRAVQLTAVPTGALPILPNPAALVAPARMPPLDVGNVIDRDVFAPDRTAPANQYLLPSEMEPEAGPAFTPPRLLVLGIAMADGGRSFATAQVGTERPTIVRVGDRLGPYTVKTIEAKRVTFALPGGASQTVEKLTSGTGN